MITSINFVVFTPMGHGSQAVTHCLLWWQGHVAKAYDILRGFCFQDQGNVS